MYQWLRVLLKQYRTLYVTCMCENTPFSAHAPSGYLTAVNLAEFVSISVLLYPSSLASHHLYAPISLPISPYLLGFVSAYNIPTYPKSTYLHSCPSLSPLLTFLSAPSHYLSFSSCPPLSPYPRLSVSLHLSISTSVSASPVSTPRKTYTNL